MSNPPPPTLKRSLRARIATLASTLLVGALAAGLGIAATKLIAQNASADEPIVEPPPISVATTTVVMQDGYRAPVVFSGALEAPQEVGLAFEQGGQVEAVLVEEGDWVSKSSVIARLDTRALEADAAARRAERAAAAADLGLARLTLDRHRRLAATSAVSQARVDEAVFAVERLEAEVARIDAALTAIGIALDKAVLRAPFDGRIGARYVDPGVQTAPGQMVAVLYDGGPLRFRAGLTETAAAAVALGAPFTVNVAGRTLQARLSRVRNDVDPTTRTVPTLFTIEEDVTLPVGALGSVTVERHAPGRGAWAPISALSEGLRGSWVVMVVSGGAGSPVVRAAPVEVLHSELDRAFLRGALDDGAVIVASGAHRLTSGQRVRIAE